MKFIILCVFILCSSLTYANQSDTGTSESIHPEIYHVATGGLWKENENYGNYRDIVRNEGWEHTKSLLYLQWLRVDDKTKIVIIHKTIPIPEINTENWHNIDEVEYHNNSFTIHYTIRGKDATYKATLSPGLPGKYSLK